MPPLGSIICPGGTSGKTRRHIPKRYWIPSLVPVHANICVVEVVEDFTH